MSVVINDVIDGNTSRLEDLRNLFMELFPQYASVVDRLDEKANHPSNFNPDFIAHQWLVDVDGIAAGMNSFKYCPNRGWGFVVYIAIRPAYRMYRVDGMRFSEWLIAESLKQIQIDAHLAGKKPPYGLCLEVEPKHLVERYQQFGYIEFPITYYEPHFTQARYGLDTPEPDMVRFNRRYLGYFPTPGNQSNAQSFEQLKQVILMLYQDHYRIGEDHPMVRQILKSTRTPHTERERE